MSVPTILQKIVATKHQEIAQARTQISLDELKQKVSSAPIVRGFANALQKITQDNVGIISEIKRASPSKGIICQDFDPIAVAKGYELAGATCLSVLTDRQYF